MIQPVLTLGLLALFRFAAVAAELSDDSAGSITSSIAKVGLAIHFCFFAGVIVIDC